MSNGHPSYPPPEQPPHGQPPQQGQYGQQPGQYGQPEQGQYGHPEYDQYGQQQGQYGQQPGQYGQQPGAYGQPHQGQYGQSFQPMGSFGAPKTSSVGSTAIILIVAIALIVVAGVVTIALMVRGGGDEPATAPVSSVPSSTEPTEPQTSGSPSESSDEPGLTADELGMELESKINRYQAALDDESHELWDELDHTDFNQTAVQAVIYFLIDMKAALIWGGSPEDIAEYQERMTHFEELLMAGEPLGEDVTIKLDDRTFTYDGQTGEGGWTKN